MWTTPIVARLREAMREVMRSAQVTSVFEKAGSPPAYLDQPDFASFVEASYKHRRASRGAAELTTAQ